MQQDDDNVGEDKGTDGDDAVVDVDALVPLAVGGVCGVVVIMIRPCTLRDIPVVKGTTSTIQSASSIKDDSHAILLLLVTA
mmetsp:Transcript_21758/g.28135  ORF Transcript_21758/g.28135 Transcript_21758/m.28135 type:complete len:81 (-) Transcript_21758:900-1142(-)